MGIWMIVESPTAAWCKAAMSPGVQMVSLPPPISSPGARTRRMAASPDQSAQLMLNQNNELPMTNSQWTSASSDFGELSRVVEPQILDSRPGATSGVLSGLKIGN